MVDKKATIEALQEDAEYYEEKLAEVTETLTSLKAKVKEYTELEVSYKKDLQAINNKIAELQK